MNNIHIIKVLLAKASTLFRVSSSGIDRMLYGVTDIAGLEKVMKDMLIGSIGFNRKKQSALEKCFSKEGKLTGSQSECVNYLRRPLRRLCFHTLMN